MEITKPINHRTRFDIREDFGVMAFTDKGSPVRMDSSEQTQETRFWPRTQFHDVGGDSYRELRCKTIWTACSDCCINELCSYISCKNAKRSEYGNMALHIISTIRGNISSSSLRKLSSSPFRMKAVPLYLVPTFRHSWSISRDWRNKTPELTILRTTSPHQRTSNELGVLWAHWFVFEDPICPS